MTIKEHLLKLMEQKEINIRELSERSGVPKTTIYAIIRRNSSSVTHSTAVKLAEALDCTAADIYGFDPEGTAEYNELFQKLKWFQAELEKEKNDSGALEDIINSIDHDLVDLLEYYGVVHGRPNKYAPIINYYNDLNEEGQLELLKRADELTQLPKYKK